MRRSLLLPLLLQALALAPAAVSAMANATSLLTRPLPFPVVSHPFKLSSELFASTEPVMFTARVDTTDSDSVDSKIKTEPLSEMPFPTGAWWTNLVLVKGESSVAPQPYVYRIINEKILVSFPFRVVLPSAIQNGFMPQLQFSSAVPVTSSASQSLTHQVMAFDSFGTTVRFSRGNNAEFLLYLVRGSPYVTLEYSDSRPLIEPAEGFTIARFKKNENMLFMNGDEVDFATFTVLMSNGQIWYLYASDLSLELELVDGKITSDTTFTGILRAALCLDALNQPLLLESAPVYPIGGDVKYTVDAGAAKDGSEDIANVEIHWKTQQFASKGSDPSKLLMLALPHHVDSLALNAENATLNDLEDGLQYTSIKGMMKGIHGNVWHLQEQLPAVNWYFSENGLFKNDSFDAHADARASMRQQATDEIIEQVRKDANTYPDYSPDVYNFGKQVGREARVLLTADRFGQQDIVEHCLSKLKAKLGAWLEGTNPDKLVYDQSFGGVVTSDGIREQDADYGNGYYNDHHFHYGYMIYALSVVRKFDSKFIESHALACAMLLGDIGSPVDGQEISFFHNLQARQLFPVARHKDWYMGHSYASGLFPMEVGKSQESSSECVNAYYALALFSSLDEDAAKSNSYHQYARLLLATELRSTKKYWQMRPNSEIYEPTFAANGMVGVLGDMSVVYNTWFGDQAVYIHGINMIPFTPMTEQLLEESYVASEYKVLGPDYPNLDPHDIWKSVIVLDHAVLDAAAAWEELRGFVRAFDTWNSESNSMYWIATRPSWYAPLDSDKLSALDEADGLCFGFSACATAGANGTALGCCSTLPGCCPSSLGCCPPRDLSSLPVGACFGEHQCALLGVACCNGFDGCCQPDPITGEVLGCCKDQTVHKPLATTPKTNGSEEGGDLSQCYHEPGCAAAGLDCCSAPGGCCANSGPKLGCCSTGKVEVAADPSVTATCDDQPLCLAAGLDCCATSEGCCNPDPKTGATLDCCQARVITEVPSVVNDSQLCLGEPQCALAGLDCCSTSIGCCQPDPTTGTKLLCCQAAASASDAGARDDKSAQTATTRSGDDTTTSTSSSWSGINIVVTVALGIFLVVCIGVAMQMCYRRRNYAPINAPINEGDGRAWFCAGIMVVVVIFFIFLLCLA